MATVGTFKKTGTNEFTGVIVTLSVQAKNFRVVPDSRASGENAPTHRLFVGRAEIGAAWNKQSNEGRPYLGFKLDDPSFTGPIYANLVEGEDGESYSLIWSRPTRRNGDSGFHFPARLVLADASCIRHGEPLRGEHGQPPQPRASRAT